MATIYKIEAQCVSAFSAYNVEIIEEIIKKALVNYVDPVTGLTLESIIVKVDKNGKGKD